jgi:hypothetical protein
VAALAPIAAQQSAAERVALPNKAGSFKFVALGNSGTGEPAQHQLAEQMAGFHERFKYDLVVLTGGNISGAERPEDYQKNFELPFKPLLDAGVKFQASLGPADSPDQRYYKLFNMGGKTYYTFSPSPDVAFFSLDSTNPSPEQLQWLDEQLQASKADWKIAFFHHSLYSSKDGPEPDPKVRDTVEPLLVKHNVAVVLSGQGRSYARLPQKGIAHFVVGSGNEFLAAEIIGDQMYFMAISREGKIVDAGVVRRTLSRP